jgi:transposase
MTQRKPTPTYTFEFRTRGIRLFKENRPNYPSNNAAYKAIASKLGCSSDSLRSWCQQAERDAGMRNGLTNEDKARLKALERENRELRQANEILKKASAYFAQAELDRPFRKW